MKRYLSIALLACLALSMSARDFEVGEKLYFNAKPSSATWWKDGTSTNTIKLWGRLVGSSAEYWIEAKWYGSDNCYLEIPDDDFLTSRSWNKLVLYRCAYSDRNDKINWTGEIDIDASYAIDKNYIQDFYYGTYKEEANWWNLTFTPVEAPTGESVDGVAKEVMEVCTSSAGDPLSLQPILAGDPLMYDYNHSAAHAWFKWNGSAWTALDGQATGFHSDGNAWGYEGGTKIKETIGTAGSSTLYFLWTEKPSRRRFLEVDVTENCDATLEITDFGVVISNLDVDNSTYTLNGIVAFNDEAVISSPPTQLRISVTDTKGNHYVDYVHNSPDPLKTPFVFSLPGLYADGATGLVAKAEFIGTGYSKLSKPFAAPDASDVEIVPLEQAYGATTTFTAPGGEDGFKWSDGLTSTTRTVPAYSYDETVKYTYYDYEKLPAKSGDLIKNGSFTAAESYYGTIHRKLDIIGSAVSEYNFWGKDVTTGSDFYDTYKDGGQSISGGMAIVSDANDFWKRYTKKISPKKDTHYALFDADNSGSKKAWYIVTDATLQPDLKLAKGTNYMFSFWVANINNYGEMNNAAKLQFAIRYKQGGSWSAEELLGKPIDLNDYQDNIWHQNSYVYTAPADANDVEIMVRDLNASANPGGNDFALDDIRFSPIVAETPAAKSIKRYVVTIYEAPTVVEKPVINIEDPACGSTKYNMTVTVNYSTLNNKIKIKFELIDDVYGIIYSDDDFDPVANPNSITIPLSSLAADNKLHNLTAKITRENGKGVDKGGQNSNKYTAPGIPALSVTQPDVPAPGCNVVTYDLDVTTTYAYQKGTQLLFYWDGILHSEATQDITYGASTSTTVTLTNLPYDGEDHTLEVKTDNTTLDCTDSKTVHSPHNPIINSITQSLEPDYVCGEDQYHVALNVNYTNALGRKICVKDGTKVLKSVTANTSAGTKTTKITDLNFDFDTDHNLKVYFEGHETCAEEVVVKSPAKPKVTAKYSVINKDCSKTTYDLEVTIHYINQNGTPHVDVDGKEAETYSPDEIEKNQPEERSLVAVVKNLPADGGTAHKLNVSFNESHGCSLDPIILSGIPHQPVINSITQSNPAYVCGENQYHDTLKVNYNNALGDKICVKEGTDVIKSVAAYTGDDNKEADILLDFNFGPDHNLKVYFEGHEECAEDVVVKSPVKPALSATSKVVNTACNKTTYDLEVTVKYTNQNGKLHVDVDGTAADDPKPGDITVDSADELTYVAVVKNLPADEGTAHTLNVSFNGNHGCHLDPIILTGIPHRPVINAITQSGPAYVCGENQYHDTLKVTYTNALGKKICVKEGTEVIKSVTANSSADKKSTIIPLDLGFGADHNLKVYFEGHEDCAEELTVITPAKPELTVTPNVINPNCDVTTYSLRLKLNYTNQRGATIFANVDGGTDITKANAYVSVMEPKEDSIQIDGLLADGKLHKFNLRFDDDDCEALNVAFNAPFGPKISTVTATVQDYACGDEKYKVKVNVSFENGQGKKLIIEDWKGTQTTITPQESDKAWHEFEYAWETPATHEYKVYFVGAETCDNHKASFKSPAEPKLTVTPTVLNPDCDVTTYSLRLDLTYTNQRGSNILANVDGGADVTKANAHKSEAAEAEEFILIENLPADGKEHTFNLRFDDSDDCDTLNVKFTAPYSPQIGTAKAAVQPYKCGDEKYKVKVEVSFANGQGHNLIIEDWKGNKQSIPTVAADAKKEYTFEYAWEATPATHAYTVYFVGAEGCNSHTASFKSPAEPKLTVTPTVLNPDCDVTTYSLRLDLKYINQRGSNILANVDGGADVTKANAHKSEAAEAEEFILIENLPADGKEHTFNLRFDDSDDCDTLNVKFTAPYSPQIGTAKAAVQPYKCGDEKYKVNVEVHFANGQGHNLIIEDWKGNKQSISTTVADTKKDCTFEYAWEAAPATHAYTVYFVGAEGCNNHKPSFKSPAEPKLTVTPTVLNPDCDVTTYSLRLDLKYTNQRGSNILANVDGGADVTKANAHKSEAAEAEEFILIENLPADGKEHTFNLRFDDSDDCDTLNVKFTAPYSPQIGTAKAAVQPYKCGDEKYKVKVEVSFANGQGHNLIIEDWKGNKQSIPTAATDAKKEFTFEYAWEATPATHAYKFYFVGAEGCNNHTASFKSPAEPKLTVTPTVLNPDCDVTTYSLRLDLTYTNQRGSNILANVDGGADVTKANAHKSEAAEAEEFILIENLPADGKEHTFNLRFDDSDDCDTLNGKFTAPYSPKIGNTTAFVQSYACGDNTYEAIVAVHFENGQGHNLIIEDWNGNKQTIATAVEDTEVVHRFEYAWEAPTTHAYKIYFVGAETCGKYKGGFEVPLWHHIDTVTVESDATVPCNDPTFNANVTIKTPYDITGVDLVLTYDDNGEKTTYAKGTGTSTVVPLVLHTIEGPDQTITVTFLADPTCGKTSDAFTPAKRAGCLKDEETVCEGDTYTWFGQDYTRPVGVDTITHGYDSLFLTVKAKPHITLQAIDLTCEDVATIALPYTVDKGEPNTFSLTVDGKAQDIIKVTATDIFIPSFEPGPHHAEVTVGVAGITCETTDTLDFTVAIAEQVYSKWTDVLFVSNKEGRYTAYQWFANNKSMEGETMQRLYDPDGLSGNNIVYYCQLTTTDGKTLYTCPKVFEEVTPSRTQDTGDKKVQSIRIYDNMGRSISGTPNNGIYIIVEQLEDGDTRVRKIAVYE